MASVIAAIATVARGEALNNVEWASAIEADRDFAKAQREAAEMWGNPEAVKRMISDQWAYEKIGLAPAVPGAGKAPADALAISLRAATEAEVSSGEALNHIFAAIVSAEAKGSKGVSAFLPPQVLDVPVESAFRSFVAGATADIQGSQNCPVAPDAEWMFG